MRIVVTGGAGFIGSNFVCHALKNGCEIINIDKLTYAGNLKNLEEYQNHSSHQFYQEDICNSVALREIFFKHKPNAIIHMAAESHVDRSIDCADEFIRANVNGTHSLLEAALAYYKQVEEKDSFRFLHLSTDEVFGALGAEGKFDETMPYKPNSPYAASKASSDLLVRAYYQTYGLPVLIVNSSNNYGPKQYPEKLIPLTILNALEGKPLPIYGSGQQIRDWLYVQDHVEGLMAVLTKGKFGESYCVGADNEIANLELVVRICQILDVLKPSGTPYKDLITYVKDRPGHDFRYATNASKLKAHTKWFPKTTFAEGLKQTVSWYINHFENLRGDTQARKRQGVMA